MKKLSATFGIICFYYLLSGVEYAVILPTLNLYLMKLHAQSFFIGLVMSSFSLSGLLAAPVFGHITDKTRSTKPAVIISNMFEIGGNFLYFAGGNRYLILGSRLIAGVGPASGSSLFGMITRCTSKEERTATFSILVALRQFGLVIGPAFNLFLRELDFWIGPFKVDAYTSPGIFMAFLFTIHTILMIFCYRDLEAKPTDNNTIHQDNEHERSKTNIPAYGTCENGSSETKVRNGSDINNHVKVMENSYSFWAYVYNDLIREEVVVCLALTFVLMFVQSATETMVTPLTYQLFNWEDFPNSIYFLVSGIIFILSLSSVAVISTSVSDHVLLRNGMTISVVTFLVYLLMIIFAVKEPVGTAWVLAVFCIYSVVWSFTFSYTWIPQSSLFSKLTSERTQGFNQGIRLLVMGISQVLGPLWVGYTLNYLIVMAAMFLILLLIVYVMVLITDKRLDVRNQPRRRNTETTSLLSPSDGDTNVA